jgi:tape measure domain-containing protein
VAINLGSAYVDIVPSTKNLAPQVREQVEGPLTRAGESAGSGFSSRFGGAVSKLASSIGSVLTTAVTGAAASAGVLGGAALAKGFSRLTTIQDATSALTISLGSSAKAATLLSDVLNVVRGTPFNLDQFAAAAQQLVGFGIDASKVPGYLTAIGEASATQGKRAGEFADRLATVFGQIAATGQLDLGSVWQVSETGVNALAILANHFDVTRDAMKKMITNGAVPAGEALDALADGILHGSTGLAGTTVALAGTMASLRQTLTGAEGGFGAALARFGANVIQPFTGALTQGFTSASAVLDDLGPRIAAALQRIVDSPAAKGLIAWLTEVPDKIGPFIDKLKSLAPAIAPIAAALGAITFTNLGGAFGPLGALLPQINPLLAAFLGLIAVSPPLRAAMGNVVKALSPLLDTFAKTAKALGSQVLPILTRVASELGSALAKALSTLVAGLAPVLPQLADAFGRVAVALAQIAVAVAPVLPLLANLAVVIIDRLGVPLIQALADVISRVAKSFTKIAPSLIGAIADVLGRLAATFSRIAPQVITAIADALGTIAVAVARVAPSVFDALGRAVGSLADAFAKVAPAVVDAFATALGAIATAISKIAPATISAIAGAIAAVADALAKIIDLTPVPVIRGLADAFLAYKAALILVNTWTVITAASSAVFAAVMDGIAFLQLAAEVRTLADAWALLNLVIDANPIIVAAAAIVGIGAAVVLAYQHFKPFRDAVDAVGRAFRTAFGWVEDHWPLLLAILTGPFGLAARYISQHFGQIVDFVSDIPGKIGRAFRGLGRVAAGAFDDVVGFFKELPGRIVSGLADLAPKLGQAFVTAVTHIPEAIGVGIGALVASFVALPLLIIEGLAKLGNWLWDRWLGPAFAALPGLLASGVQGVVGFFTSLPGLIVGAIGDLGQFVWDNVFVPAFGFFTQTLPSVAVGALQWFTTLPGLIVSAIGDLGSWIWNNVFVPAFNFFTTSLPNGVLAVLQWFTSLPGLIVGAIGDLGSWIYDHAIKPAFDFLVKSLPAAAASTAQWFRDLPGKILHALGDVGSLLVDAGKAIMKSLLKGIKEGFKDVTGFVGGIAGKIFSLKGPLDYDARLLIPAGLMIMHGLDRGLRAGFAPVLDYVSTVANAIADQITPRQQPAIVSVVRSTPNVAATLVPVAPAPAVLPKNDAAGPPLVVQLLLDGKIVSESVIRGFADRARADGPFLSKIGAAR